MFHRQDKPGPKIVLANGQTLMMSESRENQSVQTQTKESTMSADTTPENQQSQQPQSSAQPQTPAAPYMNRAPMAAVPGRMPGMGYGYPSYAGSSAANEAMAASGRKLVIGEGITISGEIDACDHLVVEGTARLSLKGANIIDIAQTGQFFGTVEISEATVAGKFEGELTVNGRLTVRSTGTITGSVSYKELAIEAGAIIDGKINPLKDKGAASQTQVKKQSAETNTAKPAPQGNELPFGSVSANAAE